MELDWDVFFGEWEPTIRGWLFGVGGIIALGFAVATYRRNGKTAREAQPRLVYARPTVVGNLMPGTFMGTAVGLDDRVQISDSRRSKDATIFRDFEVLNGSDELVGPVDLLVTQTDADGRVGEAAARRLVLQPGDPATLRVVFPRPEDDSLGSAATVLVFRDSSNRWWRRFGMHPIEDLGKNDAWVSGRPWD